MKYFEKIAVGPQTLKMEEFTKLFPAEELPLKAQAFFVPPKDLQGKKMDTVIFPKDLNKRQRMLREGLLVTKNTGNKPLDRFVRRHELTHYLRTKKGKGSIKGYSKSTASRLVEETAASAASLKKFKGIKSFRYPLGALGAVAQEAHMHPRSATLKIGLPIAVGMSALAAWRAKEDK